MGENKDYITYNYEKGSVNISEDVISALAATAATETEGVAGLYASSAKDIYEKLARKSISKGVKTKTEAGNAIIDIYIMIKFGNTINDVAKKLQDNIKNSVEPVTGLTVTAVNVHVCGVAFDK